MCDWKGVEYKQTKWVDYKRVDLILFSVILCVSGFTPVVIQLKRHDASLVTDSEAIESM